jgi:hypothetical protein
MADDLIESVVRQHLRDQAGEVHCAHCLAHVLSLNPSATEAALVALTQRRPPFKVRRGGGGNIGLKFLVRHRTG